MIRLGLPAKDREAGCDGDRSQTLDTPEGPVKWAVGVITNPQNWIQDGAWGLSSLCLV